MPGPMKPDVRFVVRRLCVPVLATSVEFATVGLPNGNQPCVVPSSKSVERVPVSAAIFVVTSGSLLGAPPFAQPMATTTGDNEARTRSPLTLFILFSIKVFTTNEDANTPENHRPGHYRLSQPLQAMTTTEIRNIPLGSSCRHSLCRLARRWLR